LTGQLLQFASMIVLARLLLPSDYGLIAIVWVFSSFAFLLADLGLGTALVQSKHLSEEAASTAFWINTAIGVVLTIIVFALAEPLAALYGRSDLARPLMLASVGFTIALTVVPTAVLERQMRFRPLAMIDVGATTLGLATTVACAAAGVGPSSLILGPLVQIGAASVAGFAVARWRPKVRPSRAQAARLLRFGSHVTGFNSATYFGRNLDTLLLGTVVSSTSLGFYNRAYSLMLLPTNQIGWAVGRVLLPVLVRLRHEPERLVRAYLRVCRMSALVICPLLIGLAASASNFVPVVFGERWSGMVPILIVLALSGPPQVTSVASDIVSQAVGKPRLLSTWGNLNNATVVLAVLAGLPWGALGVAVAFAVRAWLLLPLALAPATKAIGVTTRQVLAAGALPVVASAVMGLIVGLFGVVIGSLVPHAVELLLQILLGAGLYVAFVTAVDRTALAEILALLRRRQLAV
jgi:O-antigen/teichoic acid export membrane protein